MGETPDPFLGHIHRQFSEYYGEFLKTAERAHELFTAGALDRRLADDFSRLRLYRLAVDKGIGFARDSLEDRLYDRSHWERLRQRFKDLYRDELATTYFTSVMRKIFAEKGIPIEFDDDGIRQVRTAPGTIVNRFPITDPAWIGKTVRRILGASVFARPFSDIRRRDTDVIADIINENLAADDALTSFEVLKPPFFRGKGAYLVGQIRTVSQRIPLIICCVHAAGRVTVDAALVGYQATRSFLFSSTRSTFTVSTRHYRQLNTFLQQLFPGENPAYILDIMGFSHPAKLLLLKQLRQKIRSGWVCRYFGTGPVDLVFGMRGYPLVFKVIRRRVPDRRSVINNFTKVHTIDRLGQILDSLDYRNLKFRRDQFSDHLIRTLEREGCRDVIITARHIFFKRVYAARRITPVKDLIPTVGKAEARQLLLKVGWNIKHLAAMGFLPRSLGLEHFGLTTWERVVYLNNPSLVDIRLFNFRKTRAAGPDRHSVDPADFAIELNVPEPHRDIFRAIHGDLFSPEFWEDIKTQVRNGRYPDFFPYPSRFRLASRRFRSSVFEELRRMSHTADAGQIHMALDKLAVVDVELAGLSFLRLEVPRPSARVMVLEPIGPEIIAQLHHRFRDVTFDILQPESEVVESAGQWAPGIHGKLNTLVRVRRYDYVIGYVNETFDQDFFRLARLKGFLLLSTGTHNIDVDAATRFHTVVTNAPGPTTTTVAEQNIGLILDAVYGRAVCCGNKDRDSGWKPLSAVPAPDMPPMAAAHAMWMGFLRKTLRLDTMFSFGASELYVRTGVGERATVYHDQIGQNQEAGILCSIGVAGLNDIGLHIVELSIVHEVARIYVLSQEYGALPRDQKERLRALIRIKRDIVPLADDAIRILPVSGEEMSGLADYTFQTASTAPRPGSKIHIDINAVFTRNLPERYASSVARFTLGIQGLGRIGYAVAQRAIHLGMNLLIHQRQPDRPLYRTKLANLKKLAAHHGRWSGRSLTVAYARDKEEFFTRSNAVTTLAATTANTRGWVDETGLAQFGRKASGPVRVIVSAGKGLVDEVALIRFLEANPAAEARLDVLVDEHEGGAYLKLINDGGRPLSNLKVTGHTAAAVREVRQLKIFKALENLRRLIDGRIPPNIVNNALTRGRGTQEIIDIQGLTFFRMAGPSPVARVLVIEPLPPELVLHLQQAFGDTAFDILLAESELIEKDGEWTPGINSRLNAIASGGYDYCLGYCNANFNAEFFRQARLKGLMLFATATHHIDLETATRMNTVVTNSPGFTTVAVTEQNIAMVLDALYGRYVQDAHTEGAVSLDKIAVPGNEQSIAQVMWFMLLRRALRLDAMYEFGSGDKYVRTGVRRDATVYHDQLGQHSDAGIRTRVAVIGLDEVGVSLVELAMIFEVSEILLLEEEYNGLAPEQRVRLDRLAELMPGVSRTRMFSVRIRPVDRDELINEAAYTIKTPAAFASERLKGINTQSAVRIHADAVYINDPGVFGRSAPGLTFGVQGLGRIGEAVAQRALALGMNLIVCQRNPERAGYQEKRQRLKRLAENRADVFGTDMDVAYVEKDRLFSASHIVTTLAATTSQTRYWVDRGALDLLGRDARGPVRIFVNAGKGLLNEADLAPFLAARPDVEVRLDVLSDEQTGKAGTRFSDEDGQWPANLKIAGHTAAAVPELRRLKMLNALNNLRRHMDGKRPGNLLNPEVLPSDPP